MKSLLLAALFLTSCASTLPPSPPTVDETPQDEAVEACSVNDSGYIVVSQTQHGMYLYLAETLSKANAEVPVVMCFLEQDHLITIIAGKGKDI